MSELERITENEFYEMAKNLHGLELKPKVEKQELCKFSLDEILKMEVPKQKYILNPFFKPGQFVVIHGERKCSKSWITSDLISCVAAGEKIGSSFSALSPLKVALVDAEMTLTELKGRLQAITNLYNNQSTLSKNFNLISLREKNPKLDILKSEDQSWLQNQIQGSEVVVLDNLGVLTPASDAAIISWRKVFDWIRKINNLGTTVILVHHTNKEGQMRGTQKIADDADHVIALKRPENWSPVGGNIVEFHFESSRHLHGDQLISLSIQYYEEGGVFKRDIHTIDPDTGEFKEIKLVTDQEKNENRLNNLEIKMLTAARSGIPGKMIKADEFKSPVKDNSSSISSSFKKLCEIGLLEKTGETSASRYFCPERLKLKS